MTLRLNLNSSRVECCFVSNLEAHGKVAFDWLVMADLEFNKTHINLHLA